MNSLDNKCPSCSAPIKFNPTKQCWSCDYCGSDFTLEEMQKHTNASSAEVNKKTKIKTEAIDSYHCKNCGATIVADEYTTATFCVYCGSTAILKEKIQNNRVPDLIIPFNSKKEDAIKAFKNLSKGRPLMPKFFNKSENIEKIRGIYIPFWIYNINMDGSIILSGKRIKSWSVGNVDYIKTDIYRMIREGKIEFNNVPVDASTRFNDDIMNTIEPFDYSGLKEYNHAYLSGFLAEKYDVETDKAYETALSRVNESCKNVAINSCLGYSGVSISSNSMTAIENDKKYILLPVWMVNVKYRNKMYLFAMNGQTKELVGNIPLDIKKTIIYTVLIFIISLLVTILGSYLIFTFGG